MKYIDSVVTFSEVPDEIALCISFSNCPNRCPACHSKYLWEDSGEEFTSSVLDSLIKANDGVTCVCFMGGDRCPDEVMDFAFMVREGYDKKVCWYSGRTREFWESEGLFPENYDCLDYVKFGPYDETCGPLESVTTNQRFYKVNEDFLEDLTSRFWKK